jgi:DNA-binding NarL/FixJ family response regulator
VIRILLVDDHAAFRQPLAFMMDREADLTVAGQAGSLAEARDLLIDIDVAVVDLDLPDGNGVELISDLRAANPRGAVLILTASANRAQEAQAVEAGAAGVMHKSVGIREIIDAVRRLAEGEHLLSPREAIDLLRLATREREQNREGQAALESLTPREMEVLQALAEGLSDKEIAQRLHVSAETVRTHMVNILSKLHVDSRLQALVFAIRHGAVNIT